MTLPCYGSTGNCQPVRLSRLQCSENWSWGSQQADEKNSNSNNKKISAGYYVSNVNNINIKTRYEVCSKLTIKTPERRQ